MKTQLPGPGVKHVVVLMLENRGFDHLMGWLYDDKVQPRHIDGREGEDQAFMGLSGLDKQALADLANPTPSGGVLPINKGARSPKTPAYNTGESFEHIMNQLWTKGLKPEAWFNREAREALIQKMVGDHQPTMRGYVLDYNLDVQQHMKISLGKDDLSEVLDTYTPEQVPVLSGLARYYAVSDEWYCSVPSQTNTNRAFSLSGTSRGMVNNSFYDPDTWNPGVKVMRWWEGKSHSDELPVSTRCLFEV
ncbi:MAG: alkaline phosphatase family protein, partial [Brevundimonas sp.]